MAGQDAQRWQHLRQCFHRCLELPDEQREPFLREACEHEPALLQEALQLLADHRAADQFLERPLAQLVERDTAKHGGTVQNRASSDGSASAALSGGADPEPSGPGTQAEERIGPWRIQRLLGRGGMGSVYLAERDDQEYRDQVAIKIIRPELVNDELIARFRAERQLLADLRHPDIAQLLDGGTLGDGRPYLVMEYVRGEPIDRYCDRRRLSVPQRLTLFARVCRAVHVAHQGLVVHRDLKPANILIEDSGQPKLLDFGIAKLVVPRGEANTALTRDLAPMTLEYASPEQLARQPLTTASDVYSLGVILYELLTGRRPWRVGDGGLNRFLREVSEREATAASAAVQRAPTVPEGTEERTARSLEQIAADRSTEPARLVRQLRGDLDTMTHKALAKEPRQRYASAMDLAQDLERHLQGRPVRARPPSLSYRAGKLLRRHPWASLGSVVAILGLAAFALALFVEQQRTLRQKLRAEETTHFLSSLFEAADPEAPFTHPELAGLPSTRAGELRVRELLDLGSQRIESGLQQQPGVRADLQSTIGWAYRQLGLYSQAEEQLDASLKLHQKRGANAEAFATIQQRLAEVRREAARFEEAEGDYEQALATLEKLPDSPLREQILAGQAQLAFLRGQLQRAEELQRQALEWCQQHYGSAHERVASNLALLADLQRERGEHQAARGSYLEAMEIYRQIYQDQHPRLANLEHDLGVLALQQSDFDEAQTRLQRSLQLTRDLYGEEHPAVARDLHDLALMFRQRGDRDSALPLAEQALALRLTLHGKSHPLVALSTNLLGLLAADAGDYGQAETHHRQALRTWPDTLGNQHPWLASAHNNLGRALAGQGQHDAALAAYVQAHDIYVQTLGEGHFQVATTLNNQGTALRALDRLQDAAQRYRQALEIQQRSLGEEHADVAVTTYNLAVVLRLGGQPDEAEPVFRQTLAAFQSLYGADSANTALVRFNLARALWDQGENDQAEKEMAAAAEVLSGTLPATHPWRKSIESELTRLRRGLGPPRK